MFVNTLLFSPAAKGYTKAHPKSYEYREWWEEQKRRCLEGYSVGGVKITGDHYWYLNFWKIKGYDAKLKRKGLISPRFTDLDYEFFHAIDRAREAGQNFCIAKSRQKGFSEKFGGLIGKEFTLFPHSQSVITAGEEKYCEHTARMAIRGLDSLKDSAFYRRRNPDTVDFMLARRKVYVDGVPGWKGTMAEIHTITCRNNPQATVGKTPSIIIFEEAGMFKNLIKAYEYIQPALEAEGKKTGFAIVNGTGGEMEEGVADLEKLFYNPEPYGIYSFDPSEWDDTAQPGGKRTAFFCPAWKFEVIDNEGNSLKAESIAKIMEDREKEKSKGSRDYLVAITQKPLVPEECFMKRGGNIFNIVKLNTRRAEVMKSRILSNFVQLGDLHWKHDAKGKRIGVQWEQNGIGPYRIIEHPHTDSDGNVPFDLYVGGTDSYDRDEANSSTSKLSTSIFKKFVDSQQTARMFVARVTERPVKAKDAFDLSIKLHMYYNSMNLIEWSNILIFEHYIDNGFEWMLRERPFVAYANVRNSKASNKYGIDPSTRGYWLTKLRDYIEDNCDKLFDLDQIDAFIKFRDDKEYNCDITIGSALAIVHEQDDMHLEASVPEYNAEGFHSFKRGKNGIIQHNFKSVA